MWLQILIALDQLANALIGGNADETLSARGEARNWIAITMSADGTKLAAAAQGSTLFVSSDSGVTWEATQSIRSWAGIASSSDGTKLAAVAYNSQIHIYA